MKKPLFFMSALLVSGVGIHWIHSFSAKTDVSLPFPPKADRASLPLPLPKTLYQNPVAYEVGPSIDLQVESVKMYDMSRSTEVVMEELTQKAALLSEDQLSNYENVSVDETADPDERMMAAYFLKAAGVRAQKNLLKILTTSTHVFSEPAPPHSVNEARQSFEFSLRLMAMEALEANAHEGRGEFNVPTAALNLVNEPRLKALLQLLLAGQKMQSPLLKEFVEKQIGKVQI